MSTITQTQLVEDSLRAIGQIGPNDTADASDTVYVQRKLTALLERLQEDGKMDWDPAGDIPAARSQDVQDLLVVEISGAYGIQIIPGTQKAAEERLAYYANKPWVNRESVENF